MTWPVFLEPLRQLYELGGAVVVLLLGVSVLTVALFLFKIWQFQAAGVGRHRHLTDAVAAWDAGENSKAAASLSQSKSYLRDLVRHAMYAPPASDLRARLEADAEERFARLERGFRLLETIAQLAPLLGLFGTILGMIDAFQALQDAGDQVDPSVLAGGIWVALLTTACGLGVAMPTTLVLAWLEGRMAAERTTADAAISRILAPLDMAQTASATTGRVGQSAVPHGA